jgi:hypothetical protein
VIAGVVAALGVIFGVSTDYLSYTGLRSVSCAPSSSTAPQSMSVRRETE